MSLLSDSQKLLALQLAKMGLLSKERTVALLYARAQSLNEDEKEIDMGVGGQEMLGNSAQALLGVSALQTYAGNPADLQNVADTQTYGNSAGLANVAGYSYQLTSDGIYQNGTKISNNFEWIGDPPQQAVNTTVPYYAGMPFIVVPDGVTKQPEKIPMKAERDPNAPARRIMLEE
jgi:hypothetical protein